MNLKGRRSISVVERCRSGSDGDTMPRLSLANRAISSLGFCRRVYEIEVLARLVSDTAVERGSHPRGWLVERSERLWEDGGAV